VDAVAGEIEIHVRGDVKEVTIQFDSKVLDGLEVRVRKEGGAIAVELLTRTARAHETVRGGVDQLTASLQAKGIAVASVRVQAAERWGETSRERGGGHQGRGGGQQRGRQGEDR
jgi:flagellar hook-length control protein FliK